MVIWSMSYNIISQRNKIKNAKNCLTIHSGLVEVHIPESTEVGSKIDLQSGCWAAELAR